MLDVERLRGLISAWKDRSWLSGFSFGCDDSVLSIAIGAFIARLSPMVSRRSVGRRAEADPNASVDRHSALSHIPYPSFPPPSAMSDERAAGACLGNSEEAPFAKDEFFLLGRHIGQIEMYYSATIGSAFKINHGVGTVIGARCRIGDNCTIHQNVTIGDRKGGRPKIGNDCMIYAGSMILGDIEIGDHSVIAANAVVIDSCPPNSLLVGTPAKTLKL